VEPRGYRLKGSCDKSGAMGFQAAEQIEDAPDWMEVTIRAEPSGSRLEGSFDNSRTKGIQARGEP